MKTKQEDSKLSTILSYAETSLNKTLTTIDDGCLVNMIKDYSPTGKYDVNQEINANDLCHVFNYQYDITANVNIGEYNPELEYDMDNTSSSTDYDQDLLGTVSQPLSSLTNCANAYGLAEIYPGYRLHTKIINKDVTTDSHKCVLTLQLGVSSASNPDYTIWSDTSKQDTNGVVNSTFTVNNIENQRYIAQHEFYQDVNAVIDDYVATTQVQDPAYPDDKNKKIDIYYTNDTDKRSKLNTIMDKYTGDSSKDYDLKNNPLILSEEDYTGIVKPYLANEEKLHTNQQAVLIATDIDTNLYTLSLQWCIIDNQDGRKVKDSIIKKLDWIINGKLISGPLLVQYEIAKWMADDIEKAKTICDCFEVFSDVEKILPSTVQTLDKFKTYNDVLLGFRITDTTVLTVMTATIVIQTAALITSFGMSSSIAIMIAIGIAVTTIGFITEGFGWKNFAENNKSINDLNDVISIFYNTPIYSSQRLFCFQRIYSSISNNHNNLYDSHATFSMKTKAAVEVLSLYASIMCANQDICNVIKNYINKKGSDFEKQFADDLIKNGLITSTILEFANFSLHSLDTYFLKCSFYYKGKMVESYENFPIAWREKKGAARWRDYYSKRTIKFYNELRLNGKAWGWYNEKYINGPNIGETVSWEDYCKIVCKSHVDKYIKECEEINKFFNIQTKYTRPQQATYIFGSTCWEILDIVLTILTIISGIAEEIFEYVSSN